MLFAMLSLEKLTLSWLFQKLIL